MKDGNNKLSRGGVTCPCIYELVDAIFGIRAASYILLVIVEREMISVKLIENYHFYIIRHRRSR